MSNVPTHGNYHGYYNKRPILFDDRLAVLPANLFQGARVLDVGCNEGRVTCEIAQSRGAHLVVGVDIDDSLIQAAWRRRISVWSTQAPTHPARSEESTTNKRRREESQTPPNRHYFPASCEHELGPLPIPPSSNRGKTNFPHNVSFRTADWVQTEIPEDAEGYDVVIGFSVSKWIHLNEGDEGLKQFFKRVFGVLKPGGSFILEPQPWESYAKAKRMSQVHNAKNLVLRPADFESILSDIGFRPAQHFGFIGEGG
ncbi:Bin3-domain-containing protein [Pholiota conissans]|uniref:RNA methyltransferase n=1 Tax=Pholiota conissans TaxID=109636 RepID=A0A9P5ZB33_9AGAR|nr:Bin3-domain-containing protein [Pholiota conissans]